MEDRCIEIKVRPSVTGKARVDMTLSARHKGRTGSRDVAMRRTHITCSLPYASELSEGLAAELVTAVQLVLAGWYEQQALPF